MDEQLKYQGTDRTPKAAVVLALYVTVLAQGTAHAQATIQKPRGVMVPRVIRGQAVESAVINGVVLVFGELPVADGQAADDTLDGPPRPK